MSFKKNDEGSSHIYVIGIFHTSEISDSPNLRTPHKHFIPPPCSCVYFTFLHLVSYLTISQQFGREATGSHSDRRQVMSENGQAF